MSNITSINHHEFPIGSVVYFVDKYRVDPYTRSAKWCVSYGIVDENYTYEVCVQLLDWRDTTLVNGIPKKELVTPTRWQKLPNGWSYDTKLIDITIPSIKFDRQDYRIENPSDILEMYNKGYLVKVEDNDYYDIRTEVTKKDGWRIVRSIEYGDAGKHPNYKSLNLRDVYKTYQEAQNVIDEHEKELRRQAELTDYEWAVEQIDRELNRATAITDLERQQIRDWILQRYRVEDIEFRYAFGTFEWKYLKNKKWMEVGV